MIANVIKQIILNNQSFIKQDLKQVYSPLLKQQTPEITLVMCSDSRIAPTGPFIESTINHVFSIRNIGNQIRTSEGSVDFGVLKLKTPILAIMGHTCCSAVRKAFDDFSDETPGIKKELSVLSNSFGECSKDFCCSEKSEEKFEKYGQMNVDMQIKYALEKYSDLVDKGELTIIGMIVDINETFHGQTCQIYIVNINGENNVDKIKSMDVFSELEPNIRDQIIRSLY